MASQQDQQLTATLQLHKKIRTKNCKKILTDHIDELHIVAKGLLEYETLTLDEMKDLIKGITPTRDNFDDDNKTSPTITPSVPKTGGTTAPQTN